MNNIRFIAILLTATLLLLVPFVAMKLGVGEVSWSAFDFVAAGVMLFGAGLAVEIALRVIRKFEYRMAAFVAILIALAIVWAEVAVGIFGTPLAGS